MVMNGDPYIQNVGSPYFEGFTQRMLDGFGFETEEEVWKYFRDMQEYKDWTMGGRYFRIGHGVKAVPTYFRRNPMDLIYAIPVTQMVKLIGAAAYALMKTAAGRVWMLERIWSIIPSVTQWAAMRYISRRLGRYLGGVEDPYASGTKYSWRRGVQRRELAMPASHPGVLTAQQIAASISRERKFALAPWNLRDAAAQGIEHLAENVRDRVAETLKEMYNEDEEKLAQYGPEAEGRDFGMPYNRRTGQWYPARRRYGFARRRSYGGYNPYGGPRRRYRRSYRRW